MSLQVVTVLVLLAAAAPALGQQAQAQVFCGRQLADTLDVLCEGGLLLEKRWAPPSFAHRVRGRWARQGALRGRRQVVDECCLQPCTIDELMTYCA